MSVLANNRSLNFETFAKTMQIIIARNLLIIERCLEVKRFSSILKMEKRTNGTEQMLSSVGLLHTRFVIILNTLFINPWDEERYGVALKKRIMLTLN